MLNGSKKDQDFSRAMDGELSASNSPDARLGADLKMSLNLLKDVPADQFSKERLQAAILKSGLRTEPVSAPRPWREIAGAAMAGALVMVLGWQFVVKPATSEPIVKVSPLPVAGLSNNVRLQAPDALRVPAPPVASQKQVPIAATLVRNEPTATRRTSPRRVKAVAEDDATEPISNRELAMTTKRDTSDAEVGTAPQTLQEEQPNGPVAIGSGTKLASNGRSEPTPETIIIVEQGDAKRESRGVETQNANNLLVGG